MSQFLFCLFCLLVGEIFDIAAAIGKLSEQMGAIALEVRFATEEVHTVAIAQHVLKETVVTKYADVYVTPSDAMKSKCTPQFFEILDLCGFGRQQMAPRVIVHLDPVVRSNELDFSFNWQKDDKESDSYAPLQQHLLDLGVPTIDVSSGQGLPNGILFQEALHTLKKNTMLSSSDLRKNGTCPYYKFTVQGRTDLVRMWDPMAPLGKSNNMYFIEVKRVCDFDKEHSLREAAIQLIGGNASNSFHSPPVVLTNLAKEHYVLFITLVGDPTIDLRFKLNISKFTAFGAAIGFVEARTVQMASCTLHLGRRPTPPSSPSTVVTDSADSDNNTEAHFDSVTIGEVI